MTDSDEKATGKKRTPPASPVGNQRAVIHGGAGSERRLSTGAELIGVARDAELAVVAELDGDGGVSAVYRKRAARLQATADLYFQAMIGAGTFDELDKYAQRFTWIQGSALRALDRLRGHERDAVRQDAAAIVGSMRERYADADDH